MLVFVCERMSETNIYKQLHQWSTLHAPKASTKEYISLMREYAREKRDVSLKEND
jgi:hypothetical protein